MPNPLGVVSNPEYFTKIIQSICGTCYSSRETVESIATLQSYVDSSKTVFEKTFQTKVQEINELVSTFNTFLTVCLSSFEIIRVEPRFVERIRSVEYSL